MCEDLCLLYCLISLEFRYFMPLPTCLSVVLPVMRYKILWWYYGNKRDNGCQKCKKCIPPPITFATKARSANFLA